jgi:hypothetical protein
MACSVCWSLWAARDIAGLAINLVQVFRTLRDLHWEFLRLWSFALQLMPRPPCCYPGMPQRRIEVV